MVYILGLALILRLVLINQSLWLDEAIEALALMGRMGPLLTYALADFQPPFYHLIGWLWTSMAGYSELALRTPSLLAGLGIVYFAARLGKEFGGKKIMYLAGLLTATNPLLIYYSQEGRTYGLTTFFVTAAIYYFYKVLTNPKNKLFTIYYVLFTVAFLWTSYLSWFLHLALFVYALFLRRRDLIISQILAGLTLIFWLPSLISSLGIGLSTVASSPEWGSIVGGISLKALALTWVKANIGRISIESDLLYGTVAVSLLSLHIFVLSRVKLKSYLSNKNYQLLLVWLSAVPIAAAASLILPVYSYTRIMFVVPAYLLVLALALSHTRLRYAALIISLQLLSLGYFWVNPEFHREGWREVVRDHGRGATYALPSRAQNAPLLYYGVPRSQIIEPKTNVELKSKSIIYIKYAEEVFDSSHVGGNNLIEAGYTLGSQKVYPGLQLDLYENNN
ncbi:glycosyltransferase family 39 protein [Candidatus Woesebacteria bacterium]|nr:glycosyltransferase family 39 protein [Candidatus Woesebacteria bacterium]